MTDAASALVLYRDPEEVRVDVLRSRQQFSEVLPRGYDAERFARVVVKAIIGNPKLMECTRSSLLSSVMEAAQLGLEPTGLLGSAYLVPYRKSVVTPHPTNANATVKQTVTAAQLIIGYRGLIDLARRSGQIVAIQADVWRLRDEFDYEQTRQPNPIIHRPFIPNPTDSPEDRDRGPVVGAYMLATLAGGFRQPEVMYYDEIEAVRKSSKAADDGPWVGHWSEMARKTVVRRGSKYLPLTTEMVRALELDEEAERDAVAPDAHRMGPNLTRAAQMLVDRAAAAQGDLPEVKVVESTAEGGSESPQAVSQAVASPDEDPGPAPDATLPPTPPADPATGEVITPAKQSATCGLIHKPTDGGASLGLCTKEAGHPGGHRNDAGVWPKGAVEA